MATNPQLPLRPDWYLLMPRDITIITNDVSQLTRLGGFSFFARAEYAKSAHLDPVQAATYIHAMQKNLILKDYDMVRELNMMINHDQYASKLMLARADMIMACTEDGRGKEYTIKAAQSLQEALNRGETQNQSPELKRLIACLLALIPRVRDFQEQKESERMQIMKRKIGTEALITDAQIQQMNSGQLQTAFKKLRSVAYMLSTRLLHSQEQAGGGTNSRDIPPSNGGGTQGVVPEPRTNMMPNGGPNNRSIQVNNGNGTVGGATGPIPQGLPRSANQQNPQGPQVLDQQQAMLQAAATYQQQNNQGPQQGQQPAPMPNDLLKGGAHGGHIQMTNVKHTYAQAAGTVPSGLPNRGAQVSNVHGVNGGTTANGLPDFARKLRNTFSAALDLKEEQLRGMSFADLLSTTLKLQWALRASILQILRNP